VTYTAAATPGSTTIVFGPASLTLDSLDPLGECNVSPPTAAPQIPCTGGTVTVLGLPTDTPTNTPTNTFTPTNTPTPTETPAGPTVNKNPDISNLFLCEVGPCAGPGEGDVVIEEVVNNVTEPLGAWEIQIKFDHKIFNVEVDPNEALFTDYDRVPNCNIQIVTENWILFGCVSSGDPLDGFTGGPAVLATVKLTPNEDLKFRLHPGNDNGVTRLILDENCEIANTLGHPQPGSGPVPPPQATPGGGGGLALECGDASITVRILEGDLNLDCEVDVTDQQLIAGRYGTFFGNIYYDPWFDLEPALKDFDIDIKDLQKVFGRDGSDCQNPIPDQDPAEGLSVGPL
jgi:hypothetical protein